jgi:hypothetical protein
MIRAALLTAAALAACLFAQRADAQPPSPWAPVEGGWRALVSLPSAPYPDGRAPYRDDRVWIFVPKGFRGESLRAVVHVHGYFARVEALVPAQQLEAQLLASGRDAVLIVPQGPRDAADMALGKLERPGGLRNLLKDISILMVDAGLLRPDAPLGPVILSAHSGGYRGVAGMIRAGDLPIQAIHLFDALYSHAPDFAGAARGGAILRSSWTAGGKTERQNAILRGLLKKDGLAWSEQDDPASLAAAPITITQTQSPHARCVDLGAPFARWLEASGLPARQP